MTPEQEQAKADLELIERQIRETQTDERFPLPWRVSMRGNIIAANEQLVLRPQGADKRERRKRGWEQSKYFNYLPTPKIKALNYLLFAVYLLALCWLLLRVPFVKRSGIDNRMLTGLFLVKMAAGIAIGWLSLHFYGPANDYWDVNREAWNEYQLMITDPAKYLSNIFTSGYADGYGTVQFV